MDKQLFENTLAEFLNKAGVTLLKNGTDYNSNDDTMLPAYILVDNRRHSIYLAETNSDEIEIPEIADQVQSYSENNSISSDVTKAVTALGKGYKNFPKDFKIDALSEDLSNYTIKTSLVITEELKNETVAFLKNKNINFQNADYKNKLSVFFFDINNSQMIADIYNSIQPVSAEVPVEEDVAVEQTAEQETAQEINDDIEPVFQPKETVDEDNSAINNIDINNIPANDNTGIEYIPEENNEEEDTLNPEDEAMLDSLDISAITSPAVQEDEPKDSVEEELLYGKILREQSDIASQNQTKSIEGTFVPENMQEIRNDSPSEVTFKGNNEENNKPVDTKPVERKKFAFFDIPNKISANIMAVIFFLPVYIFNKLLGRFLPPFVIYWIGALPAIFGLYQLVLPFFPRPLGSLLESTAKNTTNTVDKFLTSIQSTSDNMTSMSFSIEQNKLMLSSQKDVIDMMSSGGWLLHYLLGFAAVLMIIPVFRKLGQNLTVFSILTYILIPSIVKLQSVIINYAVKLEDTVKATALLNFSAGIFPYIALIILFYISSQLVPDSKKRKEVLPC